MLASRKVLMKHFDARAAEYLAEINVGNEAISESGLDRSGNPVCLSELYIIPMNEINRTISRSKSSAGCMRAPLSRDDGCTQR